MNWIINFFVSIAVGIGSLFGVHSNPIINVESTTTIPVLTAATSSFYITPTSVTASDTITAYNSNWVVYSNHQYGFSFSYPQYLSLTDSTSTEEGGSLEESINLAKGDNPYFFSIIIPAPKDLEQSMWRYTYHNDQLSGKMTHDSGWNVNADGNDPGGVTRSIVMQEYPFLEIDSEPVDTDSNGKIAASYSTLIDAILSTFSFTQKSISPN
jgi:hypothetical protein